MMDVFKKKTYKPIPANARIVDRKINRKTVRCAEWTNERGRTCCQALNPKGDRIIVESKKWYGRLREANGRTKELPLCTDQGAARTILTDKQSKEDHKAAHGPDPFEAHRTKPLAKHVDEFEADLSARGTRKHAEKTANRIRKVFEGLGFSTVGDIVETSVVVFLPKLGVGLKTQNHYRTALRNFCNWMVRNDRMPKNPLKGMQPKNCKTDVRIKRRALSITEQNALLRAAETSKGAFRGLDGHSRAMLYSLALATGFRASELARLTPAAFDFNADRPIIRLEAAYTKNREEAKQPIHKAIADLFRVWIADSPSDAELWPGNWSCNAADMLKTDLKAAGIPYTTSAGNADFHALRHTYITGLAMDPTIPVKTVQKLARQSDLKLTMNVYAKATEESIADAIGRLQFPACFFGDRLNVSEPAAQRPDGSRTDGKQTNGMPGTGIVGNSCPPMVGPFFVSGGPSGVRTQDRGIMSPLEPLDGQGDSDDFPPVSTSPDPELLNLIRCWADLPEAIRQTIRLLVETAAKGS